MKIHIKNNLAIKKMQETGRRLFLSMEEIKAKIFFGMTTYELDQEIGKIFKKNQLISCAYGYKGFPGYSCLSINNEVIHGVPSKKVFIKEKDLLKIDICASYSGYCADMARIVNLGSEISQNKLIIDIATEALNAGISMAKVNNFIGDISNAIQSVLVFHGCDIVKDFSGHGIGKSMHESPEVPNFGEKKIGIKLKHGMAIAIEPMFFIEKAVIKISEDKWTVYSDNNILAGHIEDTVIITDQEPIITTRYNFL